MRILVVEDEPSLREMMWVALEKEGHSVDLAGTFAQAERKLLGGRKEMDENRGWSVKDGKSNDGRNDRGEKSEVSVKVREGRVRDGKVEDSKGDKGDRITGGKSERDGGGDAGEFDCILLDIMLPGGNGLDLLRILKEEGKKSSVIIVSARDSIDDKVKGLDLGADDYLPKPFYIAELMARIRSVARRSGGLERELALGNVRLNTESQSVKVEGKDLQLLKKEFSILAYFLQRPGYVVDKTMLAEAVWGDHADEADTFHFLYSQIKNLRRKLSEAGADIEIKAVYGFGYKLVELD